MIAGILVALLSTIFVCVIDFSAIFLDKSTTNLLYSPESAEDSLQTDEVQKVDDVEVEKKSDVDMVKKDDSPEVSSIIEDFMEGIEKDELQQK